MCNAYTYSLTHSNSYSLNDKIVYLNNEKTRHRPNT